MYDRNKYNRYMTEDRIGYIRFKKDLNLVLDHMRVLVLLGINGF